MVLLRKFELPVKAGLVAIYLGLALLIALRWG
jgi:hypothetical protein